MNTKEFKNGVISATLGSLWWGVLGTYFFQFIIKRLTMRGFLVSDFADRYPHALAEMASWLNSGQLEYRETITEGLENAASAFISMLKGGNLGKQLVKVSE